MPVDELDDFLIEKGAMSGPGWGSKADIVIVDDPIKEAMAEPIGPLLGPPGPVDLSKPDSVETLLRRGHWAAKVHPKTGAPVDSFIGTIVYDSEDDELARVERIEDPLAGTIALWYGETVRASRVVTKVRFASKLFIVEYKTCHECRGAPVGADVRCLVCNGLRYAPTARGLAPWRAEKRARSWYRGRAERPR